MVISLWSKKYDLGHLEPMYGHKLKDFQIDLKPEDKV